MQSHEHIQPLLTDYVLGDLDPADRQHVRDHAASCAACSAEIREIEGAFHSVGLSQPAIAPPAHLRARVLGDFAATIKQPGAAADAPMRRWTASPVWLGIAAAVALALGAMLLVATQRAASAVEQRQQADAEIADLREQIAATSFQADLAVSILTATDMRRIDLAGADVSRDATARGYWSATKGLLIVADRLPAPPPGRVYQVWLIGSSSAGPVSAGMIGGDQDGRGMLLVPPPGGVRGETVTIAVTDEPTGGLPAPTGAKHLVGSL